MVETTEMAIKSMDSLLSNVLSDTPEADRGKLISVCLKSIPNRMNFVECVTFVSVMSKLGFMDINNIANDQIDFRSSCGFKYYICGDSCGFTIDTDGRITELQIIRGDDDLGHDYDLPAIIALLQRLTCLSLHSCRSIPAELSNLPHLEELYLYDCSFNPIENFPIQMKLKNLKKLYARLDSSLPLPSQFVKWMTTQLPSLEVLEYSTKRKNDASFIINSLRTNDVFFHNTLKHFGLHCCLMEQESFEILMLEIVPKFKNLCYLHLFGNNIKSFLPIVDSIKNNKMFLPSKSLRVLDIRWNPVFKNMKHDPIEKAALLSFLGTFNTIQDLVGAQEEGIHDSDVEYALRINYAGRRIVAKVDCGCTNDHDGKAIVPISLWPIILKRAYEKSFDISHPLDRNKKTKNATGIYYLLREVGPALLFGGRRRPIACVLSKDGGGGVSLKRKSFEDS
ncbi:hypothetical protein FRACYDRAFT_243872 [Fragilariopsis cylindrus CCMP1102]|uniref:RNI-like protein n=1 Tax=Fragilariopsis cylindrus CCMP1102 TaxID=635003 RepID=A0A1E7F3A2_9STRA|nr:hypothetical protein FRACYDRAFT_243872 [Fragilariopsis cylindrus CCMP1102]|eukprot:OEU12619.1 hypothetical protein FRACYDRAFT_243872 [Fragilariopsis cylindrus CCMP1102]